MTQTTCTIVNKGRLQSGLPMSVFVEISPILVQVDHKWTKTRRLQPSDDPEQGLNRSHAVKYFSANLHSRIKDDQESLKLCLVRVGKQPSLSIFIGLFDKIRGYIEKVDVGVKMAIVPKTLMAVFSYGESRTTCVTNDHRTTVSQISGQCAGHSSVPRKRNSTTNKDVRLKTSERCSVFRFSNKLHVIICDPVPRHKLENPYKREICRQNTKNHLIVIDCFDQTEFSRRGRRFSC
ncbi:hypothetical protein CSKR_105872, partial [Clonorchis sinensis]